MRIHYKKVAAAVLGVFLFFSVGTEILAEDYKLHFATITYGDEYEDLALIEDVVEKITKEKIGCGISIDNVGIAEHTEWLNNLIYQDGVQDIVQVGISSTYQKLIYQDYLIPLEDYLENDNLVFRKEFGDVLDALTDHGHIYVLPGNSCNARAGGLIYNKKLAEKYDIEIPPKITLDELETILQTVKDRIPDIVPITQAIGEVNLVQYLYNNIENFGMPKHEYGILIGGEGNKIENFYTSELAKDYYGRLRQWSEREYMDSNTLFAGVLPQIYMKKELIFCLPVYYTPLALSNEQIHYDYEIGMTKITDAFCSTSTLLQNCWGITRNCAEPEMAVKFLSLLMSETEPAQTLSYGIEGIHYTKVSDDAITPIDGMINRYETVFTFFGDQSKLPHWYTGEEKLSEDMQSFIDTAEYSQALGYIFDASSVQPQLTAVGEVLNCYLPPLECGAVPNVEEALVLLESKLEQVGLPDILAANQEQYDAWLESKEES